MLNVLKLLLVTGLVSINYLETSSRNFRDLQLKLDPQTSRNYDAELQQVNIASESFHNISGEFEIDEIAKELQQQIDYLRRQTECLVDQSKTMELFKILLKIEKDIKYSQEELKVLYKSLEKLPPTLQQEFKSKLDQLSEEISQADKSNEERKQEVLTQKLLIDQCIQSLRDRDVNSAISDFKHIKNPALEIRDIIQKSYTEVNDCPALNSFLSKIKSRVGPKDENEVKAIGYSALNDKLDPVRYTKQGSDCTYQLAWNVNRIKNRLESDEIVAKRFANKVISKLPLSVLRISIEQKIHLYVPPTVNGSEIQTCYNNENGGRLIITDQVWNTAESTDGVRYMLLDPVGRYLFASPRKEGSFQYPPVITLSSQNFKKMAGNMTENLAALWKPVAVNNHQFYLENQGNAQYGQYLTQSLNSSSSVECLKFRLAFNDNAFWYNA